MARSSARVVSMKRRPKVASVPQMTEARVIITGLVPTTLEEQVILETVEERDFALDFASREREIEKDCIAVIMVRLGGTICE